MGAKKYFKHLFQFIPATEKFKTSLTQNSGRQLYRIYI